MQILVTREFLLPNGKTIRIYGRDSEFKHPRNGALYNQDGTLDFVIEAPYFKSEHMVHGIKNEQYSNMNHHVWVIPPHKEVLVIPSTNIVSDMPEIGYLESFTEMKIIKNREYAEMVISDGGNFFEFQYLDLSSRDFIAYAKWGGKF